VSHRKGRKKKKKREKITDNEEEGGKKRIVSRRLGERPISSPSLFLSLLLSSSFCFHEGEEPVCIRGERKNRKSEGKKIDSRLAGLALFERPTRR